MLDQTIEIKLSPENAYSTEQARQAVAQALRLHLDDLPEIRIEKRSLDARSRTPFYRIRVKICWERKSENPVPAFSIKDVKNSKRVLIVGAGPAGLFAALELISLGIKPVILERGQAVRERRRDLALIGREGTVNPESNYCFGEGGAGTYSDGKLYTRSGKAPDLARISSLLVHFGAPETILADARPHIGTNKLPAIITAIKEAIVSCGGEVHFGTRVVDIEMSFGAFKAFTDQRGERWEASAAILAAGHSARDLFELLHQRSIAIEAKPFALGVRIEHPQELINQIQYHNPRPDPFLPPANYQLVEQIEGRGVFSFCMCPGGIIAPCATAAREVVVNGWSPSKRNNPWANSGLVVQVSEKDIPKGERGALGLLDFQARVEKLASRAGGGALRAPALRMTDFVERKVSADLPSCSYHPGISPAEMESFLPDFIAGALRRALPAFGAKMKGYFTREAVLVGVESRTSSPVRIPRDAVSLQHTSLSNLYPCGEGAGYAGGIMSAAIDGMHVARAIAARKG